MKIRKKTMSSKFTIRQAHSSNLIRQAHSSNLFVIDHFGALTRELCESKNMSRPPVKKMERRRRNEKA